MPFGTLIYINSQELGKVTEKQQKSDGNTNFFIWNLLTGIPLPSAKHSFTANIEMEVAVGRCSYLYRIGIGWAAFDGIGSKSLEEYLKK